MCLSEADEMGNLKSTVVTQYARTIPTRGSAASDWRCCNPVDALCASVFLLAYSLQRYQRSLDLKKASANDGIRSAFIGQISMSSTLIWLCERWYEICSQPTNQLRHGSKPAVSA